MSERFCVGCSVYQREQRKYRDSLVDTLEDLENLVSFCLVVMLVLSSESSGDNKRGCS